MRYDNSRNPRGDRAPIGAQAASPGNPPARRSVDNSSVRGGTDDEAVAREVADVCGPIYEQNWLDRLYFDNHPSINERVRFAKAYRPWEQGQPLAYGQYIHNSSDAPHFRSAPQMTRPP
jgi:hypothetical protein